MQKNQKQTRFVSRIAALVIASALLWACNNEAPKEETKTDPVAPVETIDTTKKDSPGGIDTNNVTKPDGGGVGGAH